MTVVSSHNGIILYKHSKKEYFYELACENKPYRERKEYLVNISQEQLFVVINTLMLKLNLFEKNASVVDYVLSNENVAAIISYRIYDTHSFKIDFGISAISFSLLERCFKRIDTEFQQYKIKPKDNNIQMSFWNNSAANGPSKYVKPIEAPSWIDIEHNYVLPTKKAISDIIHKNLETLNECGKIIIAEGPPGTGKSYMLRSLSKEWNKTCKLHYILDVEQFFTDTDYMWHVLMNKGDFSGEELDIPEINDNKWQLLIIEDADEFISADAKIRSGQSLSKLLNISDGIVGQGLKVILVITTNESLEKLHPAIKRPGRCLAHIRFDAFNPHEATEWLQLHNSKEVATKKMTIAELFETLNKQQITTASEPIKMGIV